MEEKRCWEVSPGITMVKVKQKLLFYASLKGITANSALLEHIRKRLELLLSGGELTKSPRMTGISANSNLFRFPLIAQVKDTFLSTVNSVNHC